jgi:hypothetical protein
VAFYAVYIQEAHPSDIWQQRSNVKEGVVFQLTLAPTGSGWRLRRAAYAPWESVSRALIDGMDNSVERQYTGWPDRLMLIDIDGARSGWCSRPIGPVRLAFKPVS